MRKDKMAYRPISYFELIKLAHSNTQAARALTQYYELQEKLKCRGIEPEILYSEFNGYWVRDPYAIIRRSN